MKKTLTRRTFVKTTLGSLLTVFGIGSGGYVYAHNIEPALVEIKSILIDDPLIPQSFNGKKIVQFSDTHLGFQYNLEQLENVIAKINQLNPDIVIFTGDLMDNPQTFKETERIPPLFQQIQAPLGKFSIYGNHDHGGYGTDLYREIMKKSNFTLLQNAPAQIGLSDDSSIFLLGIDDAMLGRPDFALTVANIPEQAFKILLSHAPDLADQTIDYNIHWQLSGHSHGGQVKLPFIGALVSPPFARKYREGHFFLGGKLNLYVNRGLGTTRLPFRFLAKPEITVFTLSNAVNSPDPG